ncbi:hypothetical protein [Holophaga foetida]|uniref:hypothetical protein n=1 Tax=Holophaga foetida TaxID=35839 RepID=UPI0002472A78|nr:hypothetical protein [Holophaga foetida]
MTNEKRQKGGLTGPLRDEVLSELCERKAAMLLATPYLSFESRFLDRDGDKLRIRASMGREVAQNTLAKHPLRLRFPWELTIYSGITRILDYEQEEHRRTLVVSVPEVLGVDEQRRAYRAERMARSRGSMGSIAGGGVSIQSFGLENLSVLGAGVFLKDFRNTESWLPGSIVQTSLELDGGPSFSTSARICHSSGPYLGLEFQPPLEEPTLSLVNLWVEGRRAEAQRLWDSRTEIRAQAKEAAKPKAPPAGLLLLSTDPHLGPQVEAALEGMHELRVVPAVMTPYRTALTQPPLLLLLDTAGMGSEERRRTKALLEAQPPGCPILVVGRDPESDQARTLAMELKQASFLEWNPGKGASLRILTQGLIRKHWKAE